MELDVVAILAVIGIFGSIGVVFGIPILAIWLHHRRAMLELRIRAQGNLTDEVRAEFARVRQEIQALRDTTTRFDMSVEETMHQIQRRLEALEQKTRMISSENEQQPDYLRVR